MSGRGWIATMALVTGFSGSAWGAEPAPVKAPTVADLVGGLESCEDSTCPAMRALVERGPAVWPELAVGLDSPLEMTRFWTIGVISELKLKAALPRLIASVEGDSLVRIRAASAFALGDIGGPETAAPLIGALSDADVNVRFEAASALARAPSKEAVPALLKLLRDPDDDVKAAALEALGATGDERAVKPVIARLAYPQAKVRGYAAIVLGGLKAGAAVDPLIARTREERDADALSAALWALGEIGDARALEAVNAHVDHAHRKVKAHAVDAAAKLAPKPAP